MSSILRVNAIEPKAGSDVEITGLTHGSIPIGGVLQVVNTLFSDTTTSSTTKYYVPVTGSDTVITAKGDNSKFLLLAQAVGYSGSCGGINLGFYRGSTLIRGYAPDGTTGDMWIQAYNGWSAGSGSISMTRTHLDSPGVAAGTELTYKMALGVWTGSWGLNYAGYGNTSTMTVMEIAA